MSRLEALDFELIRQLVARYNFGVDLGDIEDVVQCFTEDGAFESVDLSASDHPLCGRFEGREQLREYYRKVYGSQQGLYRHFNAGNAVFGGDGDEVTMRSYMAVLSAGVAPEAGIVSTAIYHDRLRKTQEGWKFVERRWIADPQEQHRGHQIDPALRARH